MITAIHVDIAIIGAGPAGATCALALKASGLRVVLIDKDAFPRDKICGDAIPGPAFKLMTTMNPEWGRAMVEFTEKSEIKSSRGFTPSGRTITFNWKRYSYNSKRIHFDQFLMNLVRKETTTKIIENARIKNVTRGPKGVICEIEDNTQIEAKMVIGCDGANSITSRKLANYNISDRPPCSAVRTYYEGVSNVDKQVNEFHFFNEIAPGYFWIFPVGKDIVNVGIGLLTTQKEARSEQHNLRQKLDHLIANKPQLATRFKTAKRLDSTKGFALPLGITQRTISGGNFMLCGDAASLISPLLGHGIDTGMISGYEAAQQAVLCFKSKNWSAEFMKLYDQRIDLRISRDFRKGARVLKLISNHPKLLSLVWPLVRFEKTIKWFVRVLKV